MRSLGQETVSGEVLDTTTEAILFVRDDGTEFWVPRSVCIDGDQADEGDTDLIIATWWLKRAGLA